MIEIPPISKLLLEVFFLCQTKEPHSDVSKIERFKIYYYFY